MKGTDIHVYSTAFLLNEVWLLTSYTH